MMRRSLILLAVYGVAGALLACPGSFDVCGDGRCDPGGDGGASSGDGGDGGVILPPGCDLAKELKDAPACIDDKVGIFVSPSGNDQADGTKAAPVRSIGKALEKLQSRPRIYVCEGQYPDPVVIKTTVSVFGGMDCGSWLPAGKTVTIAPAQWGFAVRVEDVSGEVVLADLTAIAKPGDQTNTSSIVLFAKKAGNLTLRNVNLTAQDAANGADGDIALDPIATPSDLTGNTATGNTGGLAKTCTCNTGGSSTGGKGGDESELGGANGTPAYTPSTPVTATGNGQTKNDCETAGPGPKIGSSATNGQDGATPTKVGTLSANGWLPTPGANGESGKPGQGGGGGGGNSLAGLKGGGGSGACGGCGGGGGGGGKGGGASVAVLAFDSSIRIVGGELRGAKAGNGGTGRTGKDGAAGGARGTGFNGACNGANGGKGGAGGAGAGGAGGVSAAVLFTGAAPTLTGTTTSFGEPGKGGTGGAPGSNDGIPGVSGASVEVK